MPNDSLPEPLRSGGGAGLHGDSVVQLYNFLKNLHTTVSSLDLTEIQQDILDIQSSIEDLQDQIDALGEYSVPFHGQAAVPTTTVVDIVTAGAWTATGIAGDFDTPIAYGMSQGTTDTFGLKNTSGVTRVGLFTCSLTLDPFVGNNKEVGLALALDGVVLTDSVQRAFCKSGDEKVIMYTSHIISVPNNSEVSVRVANFTSTNDLEVHNGLIACVRA